jgi:hypothetical protein
VLACGVCGTDVRSFYNGDRRIEAPCPRPSLPAPSRSLRAPLSPPPLDRW